ncbi:MAG: hypothetical protein EXR87_07085 [Gammaproteobacteria bacterium]|nr:hypothetical protein [Gammaproteobacteria bacterium]
MPQPQERGANLLKEDFQQFREYESPALSAKFLDAWCVRAMRSKIETVKQFARSVQSHRELLLNYFRAGKQFSSGVIEGLNKQGQGHPAKIVRVPHSESPNSRHITYLGSS